MSDYVPNKVFKNKRVFGLIWSVFLITYGAFGYLNGQLWIPGIGASSGIIFHGRPLILVIIAIGLSCWENSGHPSYQSCEPRFALAGLRF